MPATRAFSRQLLTYIAAFLPTAPYFKSNDGRISTVCDDQYSSTFATLEETADEAFQGLIDQQDSRMVPTLGHSPFQRGPRRRRGRPRCRGRRRRRGGRRGDTQPSH